MKGCIHTKVYLLSSQRVASAGTEDFQILRLGDNEPLPAPKPAPRKEEGSLAPGQFGVVTPDSESVPCP